jgi:solute carrier family 25 carnitine/acylcarnitine transporter 20/29
MSSSIPKVDDALEITTAPDVADIVAHVPETKDEVQAARPLPGLRSLVAGGFGGLCAVIVGHPFDLVKVRLQTAERGVYRGAIDVVRKSVAKDGLARGLYAGVSAPMVGVTPMC